MQIAIARVPRDMQSARDATRYIAWIAAAQRDALPPLAVHPGADYWIWI